MRLAPAFGLGMILLPGAAWGQSSQCTALDALKLSGTHIDSAQPLPAGDLNLGERARFKGLPAFCRVGATLTPSADSDIKLEVWLPANWNGKLEADGNGGWAGAISYAAMAEALSHGYAAVSTDTGHKGSNGAFITGHPEKFTDFAWRSEHLMTVAAKAITAAFYGSAPLRSYWNGCSTGGRQGLMEATRFPGDFDGIVAGDPVTPRSVHDAWAISVMQTVAKNPDRVIPAEKFAMIHQAALKACDADDGVKDGLIGDPERCTFDPAQLVCKAGDGPDCLTAGQAATAKALLSPARGEGKDFYPGLLPGSELGWKAYAAAGAEPIGADNFKYVVFGQPDWDWKSFNPDTDLVAAREADQRESVTTTDLSPFTAYGGKLILYHGLADPLVSPLGTLSLYQEMMKQTRDSEGAIRLFFVPGMGHCGGGEGATDKFDAVAALDQWVEKKAAPKQIIASNIRSGVVTRSRPLCPYPEMAVYGGKGSSDRAENFTCKLSDSQAAKRN